LFKNDKTTLEDENKEDQTWNLATSLRVPFEFGLKQELKLGGAFRHRDRFRDKEAEEVNSKGVRKQTSKPKDTYGLTEDYFAGFLQDMFWLTDRLSLLPGVRAEHVVLESNTGDGGRADKTITDLNPSFHTLYRVRDDLSLRAAFSKSVNRPKFDELSPFEQDDGNKITIGNPDLNPARSWNYDVGADYATAHLFLGLNLFHKDITGVIEEVDTGILKDGKPVFQVENVGKGWTRGIELEQRLDFGFLGVPALNGLQLWANETLLESQLQEADGDTRRFKQQPNFIANLGVDYTYAPTGTTVTAALNYVAERRDFKATGDVTSIDPSATLDLSARQQIYKGFSVFGEIGNVTDERRIETEDLVNDTTSRKTEVYGRTFLVGLNLQL
jgi:TonB-dependent receptor